MALKTASEITSQYLFGTDTPPADLFSDSLIRDSGITTTIDIDVNEYMSFPNGPGRFAVGPEFRIVSGFFNSNTATIPVTPATDTDGYSKTEIRDFIDPSISFFGLIYQQYDRDDDLAPIPDDHGERTYIYNTSAFKISDSAQFFVQPDGTKFIKNFAVEPFIQDPTKPDNFDFTGGGIATIGNESLREVVDPSGIGRRVDFNYSGSVTLDPVYDKDDYAGEFQYTVGWDSFAGLDVLAEINSVAKGLFDDGTIKFLKDNKPIIYGTNSADSISGDTTTKGNTLDPLFDGLVEEYLDDFVGNGIAYAVGKGNDTVVGTDAADYFLAGSGNDSFDGNDGLFSSATDVAFFSGNCSEYDFTVTDGLLTARQVTVDHVRGSMADGTDTLKDIEFAQFADVRIDLSSPTPGCPGQDLAFVIDTTGSMFDDIAAVKSQANTIINSIFDPARGLENSRIAVVGFNDPTTGVILPFTDQPDPADRKVAAINAINSISVGGGGDFPELTYTGLLQALDGSAGTWRDDAVSRKIILFGDATAKDTALRSQVILLANNLNVVTPTPSASAVALANGDIVDGLSVTTLIPEVAEATGGPIKPVQIFTVTIGNNPSTIAEYTDIATSTDGQTFTATDATEIVDALLEIISLPIYSLAVDTVSLNEGDAGITTVTYTLTRDIADAAATVTLGVTGDTDGADTSGVATTVDFAVGETSKTITVDVNGDTEVELDETFGLQIVSIDQPATFATNAVNFTIVNDDVLAANNPPSITSAATAAVAENTTAVIDVDATDDTDSEGAGLTYTITGGADQAKFSINAATGALAFVAEPDFETPSDSDMDNIFDVDVTVTDSGGLTDTQSIAVTVTDIDETKPTDEFDPSDYDNIFIGDASDNPIEGTDQNDWIDGRAGRDNINGGDGNDYIIAGPGNDWWVRGGTGADIFEMGRGDNDIKIFDFEDGVDQINLVDGILFSDLKISEQTYNGISTVVMQTMTGERLMLRDQIKANIDASDFISKPTTPTGDPVPEDYANQSYGDAGDNPIQGTESGDWIDGGDGRDNINGNSGDDYIIAGPGNDWYVRGGTGADIFQFSIGDGDVKIYDFEDGIDLINLTGSLTLANMIQSTQTFGGLTTSIFTTTNGDRLMLRDIDPANIDGNDILA